MFDVLVYLYENYWRPDACPDPRQLSRKLSAVGFENDEIQDALRALPPDFRAALVLCDVVGLDYSEIASTLDIPPGTVRSRIHRGRALLRKELTANQLRRYIRQVKQRVSQPVTYADVWEFWMRNPSLADEVDFITIHILPYWEDVPIGLDRREPGHPDF